MKLEIRLTEWQREVYREYEKCRYTVVSAGRQCGKTYLCVIITILNAISKGNSIIWWVAPVYSLSKMAMRRTVSKLLEYGIGYTVNKTEARIDIYNGTTIWFKSAENESGLRGESVDFLVVDEIGLIKRDSWQYALRGTITATGAKVVFIGTPKGKNLFYELYCRGQDKEDKSIRSFRYSSQESKYFGDGEWDEIKKLPERIFKQEYLAEFVDDGGEVFRNVRQCVKGALRKAEHHKTQYYAGIDLAKSYDYTVICILDSSGHLCSFDRFNDMAWTVQKERIICKIKEYNAIALIDSTGLGDPILDDLLMSEISISGFKFTNASKRQLVEKLAISIEMQEISFPEIPELINELSIFTFEQTQSGTIRYNAPSGMHDDIVIALALAYWQYGGYKLGKDAFHSEDDRVMGDMPF